MSDWIQVGALVDAQPNAGMCAKVNGKHIAIFNFDLERWYAVQNTCPHDNRSVLSRGIIGDSAHEPKVVCPLHKNQFSLENGVSLEDKDWVLETYEIKIDDEIIYVKGL
ncbi:MAG: nitrite reductase small subunit NirD [Fibrobacterales bacterium]